MGRTTTIVQVRGSLQAASFGRLVAAARTCWERPDGWVLAFDGAGDAVLACLDWLADGRAHTDLATGPLPGIGVAVGDVAVGEVALGDVAVADVDPHAKEGFGGSAAGGVWASAAELSRLADPGQIVASEVVRLLLGDRDDVLASPLPAHPGCWELAGVRKGGLGLALPAALSVAHGLPLIEPTEAWTVLEDAVAVAADGRSRHVFVGGEAGSGKTRLLGELARARHGQVSVLYGAAASGAQAPFLPFLEALRPALEGLGAERLSRLLAPDTVAALRRILPVPIMPAVSAVFAGPATASIHTKPYGMDGAGSRPLEVGGDPPDPSSDPETDRYWAFEATVDLLNGIGSERPVLLALDDVHWADPSSVALLEHLLRSSRLRAVTIVVAYRNTSADHSEAFAAALGESGRIPSVRRCVLQPLTAQGVASFLSRAARRSELPPVLESLAAKLTETTGGNPFLLTESWRHLVDSKRVSLQGGRWVLADEPLDSPRSVRELTERRLSLLSDVGRVLIELAACAGPRFEVTMVGAAAEQSIEVALDLLSRAAAVGLVRPIGPGHFEFSHSLIRQAIEEGQGSADRPRRHRALAQAYQRLRPNDDVLLAHHFAAAAPLPESTAAAAYALSAANRLVHTVAYDHAVAVLDEVLAVTPHGHVRLELLVAAAHARSVAGASVDATRNCAEAVAIARSMGDYRGLVRAALVMAEATWRGAFHGGAAATLLGEALELATDPVDRIKLQAGLSAALALSGKDAESAATAAVALQAARLTEQPRLILDTLHNGLYVGLRPELVHQQLANVLEGIELADVLGDEESRLHLCAKALLRLMVVPDVPCLATEARRLDELAVKVRQPYYLMFHSGMQATIALSEGRFEDTEAAIERYQHWAQVNQHPEGGYGIQMFSLRREQGRLHELRPMLELAARLGQDRAAWGPGLAAVYAEVGMLDDARRLLDRILEGPSPPIAIAIAIAISGRAEPGR